MDKLSKREKFLIYMLALVVIVAGGLFYMITPLDNKIEELDNEITAQDSTVQEMQMTISTGTEISSAYEENQKKLEEEAARYYSYMNNDEISQLLTKLVQNAGLQVLELSIGDTASTTVTSYLAPEGSTGASMLVNNISATVSGTADATARLADVVSASGSMRLLSISSSGSDVGGSTYIVEIAVYMHS